MWPYNQEIYPPAPFLDIIVHHPTNPAQVAPIRAKIDTAADISAIPATLVTRLGLSPTSQLTIEGYNGLSETVFTHYAVIEVAQVRFRVEVIAIPDAYALLGRDILNYFYTLLNGPDLTFNLSLTPQP
jgi:hypothetical protein